MRPTNHGRTALALVALASTAGCSWIFTQPLREDRSPYDFPVCSTSLAPPTTDTLLFLTNAATTLYEGTRDNISDKTLRLSVGAGAATLWLLSAIYGYTKTGACAEAVSAHDRGDHPPAPFGTGGEVFTPPPPPPPGAHPAGVDGEDPRHPQPPPAPRPLE
jgi:hypothetical protein